MKMKKILFYLTITGVVVFSVSVGSCNKDSLDLSDKGPLKFFEKPPQSLISRDKKDREILFISKRDGTTDEIYSMNLEDLTKPI